MVEKLRAFQQFNSGEEKNELFTYYLEVQGLFQSYINELKQIITAFVNSEKLSIDLIGYQPQAKTTVIEILENDFSKYCQYELMPSKPNTPIFFNLSQLSSSNKVNATSTTPTLTGSDSEIIKNPALNFKI